MTIKKITPLLLAMLMFIGCIVFSKPAPAYAGAATKVEVLSTRQVGYSSDLGWHPGLSEKQRASGYYFSASSKTSYSLSTSFGYGPISVSVDKYTPSAGYIIPANYNVWTRPRVYGDVWQDYCRVTYYDRYGRKAMVKLEYKYRVKNTWIKAIKVS